MLLIFMNHLEYQLGNGIVEWNKKLNHISQRIVEPTTGPY